MAKGYIHAARALEALLGRRNLWRLGRLLYQHARRDGHNNPATNGEYLLHSRLACLAREKNRPLCVVDVGANVGYWSRHLLEECRTAGVTEVRLVAFEPSPEIRDRLTETLKGWPSSYRVTVRPEAIAEVVGHAAFEGGNTIVGTKHLLRGEESTQPGHIEVNVTTLDAIFDEEGIAEADLVKSDVEGFDFKVIEGARPLLETRRIGLMQFEYNHRWVGTRSFLRDVFDLTRGLSYRVCKVTSEGIEAYVAWQPEMECFFETNYILVRDDLMEPLGVREGSFDARNAYAT